MKCPGGRQHAKHVTLGLSPYDGAEARCVFCGKRIGSPLRRSLPLKIMDWPGEIVNQFRARWRGQYWPHLFSEGVFFY